MKISKLKKMHFKSQKISEEIANQLNKYIKNNKNLYFNLINKVNYIINKMKIYWIL